MIRTVYVHSHVRDNMGKLCDAENSWLPVDIDNRETLCDDKAVCIHVHMVDNRGTLCDAENSWLPVDVDNRETLCDDTRGLHACSRGR